MQEKSLAYTLIEEAIASQSKFLDLGNCGLTDESPELEMLKDCTFLEGLNLGAKHQNEYRNWVDSENQGIKNRLQTIPAFLPNQLIGLYLIGNRISKIENLDALTNLSQLDLNGNKISIIENLDALTNLNQLNLGYNEIMEIKDLYPLFLRGFKLSQTFNLDKNTILIGNNPLNELSKELVQHETSAIMAYYESLDYKICILKEKTIKTGILDLTSKELEEIPIEIYELDWLKSLNLSNNTISSLKGIEVLKNLNSIVLYDNLIEDISPLYSIENLEFIDLGKNKIENLNGIDSLKKIKTLWLERNQIKSIFPLLGLIKLGINISSFDKDKMGYIDISNNPISEPPIEKIEQGREAILEYFQESKKHGKENLNILKIIILGNSSVGKSDLSRFLRNQNISKKHDSTEILEIKKWDLDIDINGKDQNTIINLFDFGGQDYYHDSHRMFYSSDTAYILIWDTETNRYGEGNDGKMTYENFPISYWLESIHYNLMNHKSNGSSITINSPILILQNKIDTAKGFIDQIEIKNKYPNVWDFYSVSLQAKLRTKILKDVLKEFIESHKLVGRELIKYEYVIFQHFNDENNNEIYDLDTFTNKCLELISDKSIDFDAQKAKVLARMLHNSGLIFFHETENDQDIIIFSNIIDFNQKVKDLMTYTKEGNDMGFFNINKKTTENIPYINKVVDILKTNNSITHIHDSTYVTPQFLPVLPHENISYLISIFKKCNIRYHYPSYFHKSLLLNLFATYFSSSENITYRNAPFWRNGLILKKNNSTDSSSEEEHVLIEFLKNEKGGLINLKSLKSYDKHGFIREVEKKIDEFNKNWTVYKEISLDGVNFIRYHDISEGLKNKKFSYHINDRTYNINDFKTISEFDDLLPARLFISYSSKNTDFVKRFSTHLEVLKRNDKIDYWYDRKIEDGTQWDNTIKREMEKADLFIFLLSPFFITTPYIVNTEIPFALERCKSGDAKVLFVQLQSCSWGRIELLKPYQMSLDKTLNGKSVISVDQPENDKAWNEIIDLIELKLDSKEAQVSASE